jgi:hypothetical protein
MRPIVYMVRVHTQNGFILDRLRPATDLGRTYGKHGKSIPSASSSGFIRGTPVKMESVVKKDEITRTGGAL